MTRLHALAMAVVFGFSLSAAPARASNAALAEANQKLDKLQYRAAADALQRARTTSGLSHAELVEVLQLQGVTSATLGNTDEAEGYFRELVAVEPEFKLPKRWGPKIQTIFFSAKSWLDDQQPMTMSRQPPQQIDGKIVGVQVQLGPDPLQIVRRVRVYLRPEGGTDVTQTREVHPPATVAIAVTPATTVRWWAESLGEHEEVLQALGSLDTPLADQATVVAPVANLTAPPAVSATSAATDPALSVARPVSSGSPPLRPLAYVLGGVGGAALVTGAVFGVKLSNENSQLNNANVDSRGRIVGLTQSSAVSLVNQAQTDALLTNVMLASGAVLVAGGTGVWIWGALNPEPGGGGEVGISGRW